MVSSVNAARFRTLSLCGQNCDLTDHLVEDIWYLKIVAETDPILIVRFLQVLQILHWGFFTCSRLCHYPRVWKSVSFLNSFCRSFLSRTTVTDLLKCCYQAVRIDPSTLEWIYLRHIITQVASYQSRMGLTLSHCNAGRYWEPWRWLTSCCC